MNIARHVLEKFLNDLLQPERYSDYGPNGLQVEGRETISRAAFAVSATRESIDAAIQAGADALIVHHGLLWDFHGVQAIRGAFGRRLRPLIQAQLNLFGYHLPLDGHPVVGNAAGIAQGLDLENITSFGLIKGMPAGVQGGFREPTSVSALRLRLETLLRHPVLVSTAAESASISTLGIITGRANAYWKTAAELGLDAFLTGEMSEHDWHDAKEGGMHMFAGGHHATEVFGVQRLMQEIRSAFGIDCVYLESANPA